MPHETPLITTIVAGLVLAFILGSLANRLRLPPLVGYLLAGVLVGPHTPGFVADQHLGAELAELGVILLMFGVGLHFSLKDLMSVRALAIPGALAQIAFATLLGLGLALLLNWGLLAGLVFGLALSVASTVVLLKAMQDRRLLETERGRIAVGWLIVEDLAMVLALVLIPALASAAGMGGQVHDPFVSFIERISGLSLNIYGIIAVTVVKIAAFVGFMLIVGRRVIPYILHETAHSGNRELFRLAVLAIALGVALGSAYLFGVSLALGAFFAGMILSESQLSQRAAQETLPLRDAFAVLFFVSVGMLFDPTTLLTDPLPILATVFIIVVGKSLAAFAIVIAFRRPVATALTISASLAQIGEFSFILAAMGVSLAILPQDAQDLILAGALLSIILNPLVFFAVDRLRPLIEARTQRVTGSDPVEPSMGPGAVRADGGDVLVTPEDRQETPVLAEKPILHADEVPVPTALSGHVVLVGFGRVGRVVAEGLKKQGTAFLVIEDADGRIKAAREKGFEVIVGNGASPKVLDLCNVEGARSLLIGIPNAFEAGQVTEQCRKRNAGLKIIARAHSEDEEEHLKRLGADVVVMGEREIGLGMLGWLQGAAPVVAEPPVKLHPVDNVLTAAAAAAVAQPLTAAVVEPSIDAAPEAAVEEATVDDFSTEAINLDQAAELELASVVPEIGIAPEPIAEPEELAPVVAEAKAEEGDVLVIAEPPSEEEPVVEARALSAQEAVIIAEPPAAPIPEPEAEPETAVMPSEPPAVTPPPPPVTPVEPPPAPETVPAPPVEEPVPAIPVEAPVPETPGTDPAPQETPVQDPTPRPDELPGQTPTEDPEPARPPVEVPDQPVPETEPTPQEIPVTDPAPSEVPPVTPERRDPPTVANKKE